MAIFNDARLNRISLWLLSTLLVQLIRTTTPNPTSASDCITSTELPAENDESRILNQNRAQKTSREIETDNIKRGSDTLTFEEKINVSEHTFKTTSVGGVIQVNRTLESVTETTFKYMDSSSEDLTNDTENTNVAPECGELEEKLSTKSEIKDLQLSNDKEQNFNTTTNIFPFFLSESVLGDAIRKGREFADKLFDQLEPDLAEKGVMLNKSDPGFYVALLSQVRSDRGLMLSRRATVALEATVQLARRFELSGDQINSLESLDVSTCDPGEDEEPDPCPSFSHVFRTPDGRCNNLRHPSWGRSFSTFRRWLPPEYADGVSAPRTTAASGFKLPSARKVSRVMGQPDTHHDEEEDAEATLMLMQWGQLVDHDLTRGSIATGFRGAKIRCCGVPSDLRHPACFPISIEDDDPLYGRITGVEEPCLEFVRSSPAPRAKRCSLGPLEQMNQVTAYLDGSPVYGSSSEEEARLRLFRKGMMRESEVSESKPLLPAFGKGHGDCLENRAGMCFQAGDSRVNEQPGLTAMHTLWVREHNRLAAELNHLNSHWGDERLYQESRRIVGALLQHITYSEFLPAVIGHTAMRLYNLTLISDTGRGGLRRPAWAIQHLYDPDLHAGIANVFSTAAFRFGHSLVHRVLRRFAKDHSPIIQGGGSNNGEPPPLHTEFFRPSGLWRPGNVDSLLLGLVNEPSRRVDARLTPELSGNLFRQPSSSAGTDLFAINIQRARDHGIPPYTAWRRFCGFRKIMRFVDLKGLMSNRNIDRLSKLYRSVEDLDLFPAALAEFPVAEGMVGPTLACLLAKQFSILRRGDRFWFENANLRSSFTEGQLSEIQKDSLARVLCDNLDEAETVQLWAMKRSDDHRCRNIVDIDRILEARKST